MIMAKIKEQRSNIDRRRAAPVKHFPILDSNGAFIEYDRRSGLDRRDDSSTTLQFIKAEDFLASLSERTDKDL